MFDAQTYKQRREDLCRRLGSGCVLFLGHDESPMNYADNAYRFRQDSAFLYYLGLDSPGLAALVDVDEGRTVLFGHDPTMDDIVWTGPQPSLAERCLSVGVAEHLPPAALAEQVHRVLAASRRVHYLPQSRAEGRLRVEELLGVRAPVANQHASRPLVDAVVAQRSVKSAAEVAEIEAALEVTRDMYDLAMREARPGRVEREVAGAMEGLALSRGCRLAFPTIFSIKGETLHNHCYDNRIVPGRLIVHDSGAEAPSGYASDITRTYPSGTAFEPRQRDVYETVLRAQLAAIAAIRPGVPYREVHLLASRTLATGLRELGCLQGDVEEIVAAGAHALFFPHGLGHMMGLDVHDMEGLGEDRVGYDATVQRSTQFGLRSLRMARALQPGFVVTVEPGLYFIPDLVDRWKAERKLEQFVDYEVVERFRGLGGVRIEDDVLVTETGGRVLGPPIPKAVSEIESLRAA